MVFGTDVAFARAEFPLPATNFFNSSVEKFVEKTSPRLSKSPHLNSFWLFAPSLSKPTGRAAAHEQDSCQEFPNDAASREKILPFDGKKILVTKALFRSIDQSGAKPRRTKATAGASSA